MSTVINLVEDHNIYLCEGGPVYNGGVQPTPITYLTKWKIVGNSEVHTDPYLTSWKVSGNSVVDNNTILSCGDLGQDGKYHVKISNGTTIYDIPLTEPLRKVNDVADSIEFPSGTEGKALVTRPFGYIPNLGSLTWYFSPSTYRMYSATNIGVKYVDAKANILCPLYDTVTAYQTKQGVKGIATQSSPPSICVYDEDYITAASINDFIAHLENVPLVFALATPTTELVDVSPFPVSSTDTYTSANVVPFSAFEHTENKEIWSCGEYNATDGKYHILVQPQGGNIADIALDAPLRKVNNVADTIEFPSDTEGKALVTRNLGSQDLGNYNYNMISAGSNYRVISTTKLPNVKTVGMSIAANILCALYRTVTSSNTNTEITGIALSSNGNVVVYDKDYNQEDSASAFKIHVSGVELIYELATPTTELVDAPQIAEADSYSMVISQGGKAVEWSSFETYE